MAQAEQTPESKASERAAALFRKYDENYQVVIEQAEQAAETTQTHAWQRNYAEAMKNHQEIIARNVGRITTELDTIKVDDTSEDIEKEIKAAVKNMVDERIRHEAWRARAVLRFVTVAENAASIIEKILYEAGEREREAPLVERGLADEVRELIKAWPKIEWDDETGVVTVS